MSEGDEVTEAGDETALAEEAAAEAADEALDRAVELLGLAEPEELSDESYAQVFVDTVPAFYSGDADVVTLVEGASGSDSTQTLTLLHEFVHALQDQAGSLAALDTDEELSFDQYLAALSIVEGEAEMLESFGIGHDLGKFIDNILRKIRHSLQVFFARHRLELKLGSTCGGMLIRSDLADLSHRIEDLVHRLPGVHRPGELEEPVGERGLPVVDVGDDREVADPREVAHRVAIRR